MKAKAVNGAEVELSTEEVQRLALAALLCQLFGFKGYKSGGKTK